MSTTRYEVPPAGGFYAGIPGIWQGGDVFEVDDETGAITVIKRAADEEPSAEVASTATTEHAAPDESAAAKPA